jgi:biotin carboxyl carrier protein
VASPIAGTVLEIRCRVGERVEKDQILLVLEAMKMKTSIAAPLGGRIARLAVAAGDPVREGETLVELE